MQSQILESKFKIPVKTNVEVKLQPDENKNEKFGGFFEILPNKKCSKPQSYYFDKSKDAGLANEWSPKDIRKLFTLYDQIGPQWKTLSLKMPSRTSNQLKNRFYTVLRNLIKLLFRQRPQHCPKLLGQIPSRQLVRLYNATQNYSNFPNLMHNILSDLQYDMQNSNIGQVVEKHEREILSVYQIIYREKLQEIEAKKQESRNWAEDEKDKENCSIAPANCLRQNYQNNFTNWEGNLVCNNVSNQQPYFYLSIPNIMYWNFSNF